MLTLPAAMLANHIAAYTHTHRQAHTMCIYTHTQHITSAHTCNTSTHTCIGQWYRAPVYFTDFGISPYRTYRSSASGLSLYYWPRYLCAEPTRVKAASIQQGKESPLTSSATYMYTLLHHLHVHCTTQPRTAVKGHMT